MREHLKNICTVHGWQMEEKDGAFIVSEKDIWDGVEFISSNVNGEIYRIFEIEGDEIWLTNGTYIMKDEGSPSTEQAYVDQLKKRAIVRFGEIKAGDEFDRDFTTPLSDRLNFKIGDDGYSSDGFSYAKGSDSLMFNGHSIYQQGKWATKVTPKKRIYISGKISGLEYIDARSKFAICSFKLTAPDTEVINPMAISPFREGKTWEEYMSDCMAALLTCHAIYMQKDWGQSRGARVERAIALELGLEIIYE